MQNISISSSRQTGHCRRMLWAQAGLSLDGCTRWHCATTVICAQGRLQVPVAELRSCSQWNDELHCPNWLAKTDQGGQRCLLDVTCPAVENQSSVLETHELLLYICLKVLHQWLQTSQNGYILINNSYYVDKHTLKAWIFQQDFH